MNLDLFDLLLRRLRKNHALILAKRRTMFCQRTRCPCNRNIDSQGAILYEKINYNRILSMRLRPRVKRDFENLLDARLAWLHHGCTDALWFLF